MRLLATDTEGYLGSPLDPRLLWAGHEAIRLDTGYDREGLRNLPDSGQLDNRLVWTEAPAEIIA